MEANLRFKIDWASLTVGRKFTFFALFYFVFEGNCQVQAPGGLIFGRAYTQRGLFSEFYGILQNGECRTLNIMTLSLVIRVRKLSESSFI